MILRAKNNKPSSLQWAKLLFFNFLRFIIQGSKWVFEGEEVTIASDTVAEDHVVTAYFTKQTDVLFQVSVQDLSREFAYGWRRIAGTEGNFRIR